MQTSKRLRGVKMEHKFTPVLKLEHSDKRGEIYSIMLPGDRELMLLHSTAGALRGGHSHDVDEIVVMLTGKMNYYKTAKDGKQSVRELKTAETSFNPAGEIHMGEFLEDSWLLEWKLNTTIGAWKNFDYEPYRAKVKANIGT